MSRYQIRHAGKGRCLIRHLQNQSTILTDLPPEYSGEGRSFSSTDMVSAAIGSCCFSSFEEILKRDSIDPETTYLEITKELQQEPKRIASITIQIFLPRMVNEITRKKLIKAASFCPVKRSLHPDISLHFEIKVSHEKTK